MENFCGAFWTEGTIWKLVQVKNLCLDKLFLVLWTEDLIWKDFAEYCGVKPDLENNNDGVCSINSRKVCKIPFII